MNEESAKFEVVRITHRHTCAECGQKVSVIASLERKANGDVVFRHIACAEKMAQGDADHVQ